MGAPGTPEAALDAYGKPLPAGWQRGDDPGGRGESPAVYENRFTHERIAWIPRAAASAVPGASPDLDPNAGLPDGVHAAMSASRPGQLVFERSDSRGAANIDVEEKEERNEAPVKKRKHSHVNLLALTRAVGGDEHGERTAAALTIQRNVWLRRFRVAAHVIRFASSKRWVGAKMQLGLLSIDNQKEQFTVDLCIFLHWKPRRHASDGMDLSSDEDGATGNHIVRVEGAPSGWLPSINLLECDDFKEIERSYFHNRTTNDWFLLLNYIATVRAELRLQRFPFDRQNLKARVEFQNCSVRPWRIADEDAQPDSFVSTPNEGITVYNTMEDSWHFDHAKSEIDNMGQAAEIGCNVFMQRKPAFFLWNVVVVMFPIVATAASAVAVPGHAMADRMSISLTLMLTAVAFKFVLMGFIPPVSYLTFLDIYVIVATIFLSISIAENFVVAYYARAYALEGEGWPLREGYSGWADDDLDARADFVEAIDFVFAPVFLGAWVLLHALIFLGVAFGWFYQSWEKVENPPNDDDTESTKVVKWKVQRSRRHSLGEADAAWQQAHSPNSSPARKKSIDAAVNSHAGRR